MKVVKYYYSKPLIFFSAAHVPQLNQTVAPVQKCQESERYTIAAVLNEEAGTISFGIAICSPDDRFERKIGRELAEKRANESPLLVIKDYDPSTRQFGKIALDVAKSIELQYLTKRYKKYLNIEPVEQ